MKNNLYFLAAVALGLLPGAAATNNSADDLNARIAQLSRNSTTVEEVLRAQTTGTLVESSCAAEGMQAIRSDNNLTSSPAGSRR